ncbi:MAG TPA: hypothetical protein VLH09_11905, partial [Bryobacteraceae bacterium]|nr:hypothetical protein [Bryobacteraceae bacterium]
KPALAQNQFGATVGGPIRKNRLFCFADYEGFRRVTRQLTYASLPTADQRAGRFGVLVQNPYTGAIYSGGVIPQSEIAEFARKVMADLPGNVRSATSNNIESLPRSATTDNKGDARLDYHHSSRVTLP